MTIHRRASTDFHALLRSYHRAVRATVEANDREAEKGRRVIETELALDEFVADLELYLELTNEVLLRYEMDQGYTNTTDRPSVRITNLMLHHGYDT